MNKHKFVIIVGLIFLFNFNLIAQSSKNIKVEDIDKSKLEK